MPPFPEVEEGERRAPILSTAVALPGLQIGPHKAAHDYFVQDSHCLPVFREGWSAADEMHLLDGLEIVGWVCGARLTLLGCRRRIC